jgi:hypothetical protein
MSDVLPRGWEDQVSDTPGVPRRAWTRRMVCGRCRNHTLTVCQCHQNTNGNAGKYYLRVRRFFMVKLLFNVKTPLVSAQGELAQVHG